MKLLTNKQFQGEIEKAIAPLKQENKELNSIIANKEFKYLEENEKLNSKVKECKDLIFANEEYIKLLEQKVEKLIEDKKLLFGAKGGLTKYTHRLKKELDQCKKELSEANEKLSQRYIVKELKPQKAKNTQVMKTKSGAVTSKIIKKVVADE